MNRTQNKAFQIHKILVRTTKEDSAFFYHVLEASEGIATYSTVNYQPGDRYRDVELLIPDGSLKDVKELLVELGDVVEILTPQ